MNQKKHILSLVLSLRNKDARTRTLAAGYIEEHCPIHPACNSYGYLMQHRLVMEDHIGRFLTGQEVVHHVDHDKQNNNIENLQIFPNQKAHMRFHRNKSSKCSDPAVIEAVLVAATDHEVSMKSLNVHHRTIRKICSDNGVEWMTRQKTYLTEDQVREALQERSVDEAAEYLGVSRTTLYRNWSHLLNKRRPNSDMNDPEIIEIVRRAAANPYTSYRSMDLPHSLVRNICLKHGFDWVYRHAGSKIRTRKTPNDQKK